MFLFKLNLDIILVPIVQIKHKYDCAEKLEVVLIIFFNIFDL
jgi:hypothetical protein